MWTLGLEGLAFNDFGGAGSFFEDPVELVVLSIIALKSPPPGLGVIVGTIGYIMER